MNENFLTRSEAAAHLTNRGLPIAAKTLAKMASIGGGPPYRVFGRNAVYLPSDLEVWATERLGAAKANTSQKAA